MLVPVFHTGEREGGEEGRHTAVYSLSEKTERELVESFSRPRRTRSRRFPSLGCMRMKRVPKVPLRRSRWPRAVVVSKLAGSLCREARGKGDRNGTSGGGRLTRGLIHHRRAARHGVGPRQSAHRILAYLWPKDGPVDPVLPLLDLLSWSPFSLGFVSTNVPISQEP